MSESSHASPTISSEEFQNDCHASGYPRNNSNVSRHAIAIADNDRCAATEVQLSETVYISRERLQQRVSLAIVLIAASISIFSNSVAWLVENAAWFGLLGTLSALYFSARPGVTSRFLFIWFCSSCAVGAAFHWTPTAMAYTLSSDIILGTVVAAPLVLWESLRMALGYWIAARITTDIRYHWLAAAVTTIALEYLMPGVFPWAVGQTLLSVPWTLQAVEIFGPSFATFVVFAMVGTALNGLCVLKQISLGCKREQRNCLSTYLHGFRAFAVAPATIILSVIFLYNTVAWEYWVSQMEASPKLQLGVIQVDPSFKDSHTNANVLTASILDDVDLVCWPESSGGNYDLQLNDLHNSEHVFQNSRDPMRGLRPWPEPKCELLLAGKNYVGDPYEPDKLFVTAMLIDEKEHINGRYNKRFLMPFGEYVPGEKYVPGLGDLFDMDEQIEAGVTAGPLASATGARIGTMLCYEDMVPRASREAVALNANLLISLINGSAFESRFTLLQHRLLSHMRAIECRKWFVRCAATGETCCINPLGQIESRLPMQTDGALVANVGLLEGKTFYCRFPWTLPAILVTMLIALIAGRKLPTSKNPDC